MFGLGLVRDSGCCRSRRWYILCRGLILVQWVKTLLYIQSCFLNNPRIFWPNIHNKLDYQSTQIQSCQSFDLPWSFVFYYKVLQDNQFDIFHLQIIISRYPGIVIVRTCSIENVLFRTKIVFFWKFRCSVFCSMFSILKILCSVFFRVLSKMF